jgi:xylan 1,4-beta-xylosidase
VGSGHAPLALRADWQAQLKTCHRELGFRHVRFHGILSYPMDTVICHQEELLYSFFNADQIVDFLLSIGMRPFVELSFMPVALASGSKTVFHYQSNVTPPKDYDRWAELMRRLVSHWVERYGLEEVRQWFFEVWNEPNIEHFWTGTQDEYFRLYHVTVEAIKDIDPSLRVGGPATARNAWIVPFLDYCARHDLPVDFVSTHHYPTDAFGQEGDDTVTKLAKAERGVLQEQVRRARRRAQGHPLYYTEWNTSSNPRDPLHDLPYAAAFITRTIMEVAGMVEGYSFWTFSDIFQENYFPSTPFHGGFGLLNLHGIPKPAYRAYQLLHRLGTQRLAVEGRHGTVDAWAVRGEEGELTVLLTNHALPRHPITTELARVELTHTQEPRAAFVERIDERHANPRRAWEEMGRPEYLSQREVDALQAASRLVKEPLNGRSTERGVLFEVDLPPHSVAALTIEW